MAKRFTKDEFCKKARSVHGEKYDYSKVDYVNSKTKVCIICPKHGSFWQTPSDHFSGCGCPKCANEHRNDWRRLDTALFIKKAKKIHGEKYDYSKVDYKKSSEKVCIVCPKHGEFWQTPNKHLLGRGCSLCFRERLNAFVRTNEFKEKFRETCLSRYGVEYPMMHQKIKEKAMSSHLKHQGFVGFMFTDAFRKKSQETKRKNGTFNTSKIQDELYLKLKEKFGEKDVEEEYRDNRYPFHCDFYIKSLNLFIELNAFWTHGKHWFDENSEDDIKKLNEWKQKDTEFYQNAIETWTERDVKKRECARKNNLNYVVLWNKEDIDNWFSQGCPVRKDWK